MGLVIMFLVGFDPLWTKITVTVVLPCCWWWDDVATVLAVMSALHLYEYLHQQLGTYFGIGIPVVELICLALLRFLFSNYWKVLISFTAYVIALVLTINYDFQRYGAGHIAKNIFDYIIWSAPLILLLSSFLLAHS